MHKIIRIASVVSMLGATPVWASDYISAYIPDAKTVGQGRMTFLMWDVYDATLYAQDGTWREGKPLALTLSYLRDLNGEDIARRSIEEMRRQGFNNEIRLATWFGQMKRIFPDVTTGVSLSGVLTPDGVTVFFRDGVEIGRINDPDFGLAFFNIWLSQSTSVPELRAQLLGRT
ncbi:MAG: chalcone isomerase family protein [Alphaproteobacteria bacterium]|nr:chalcone isomerase family protein [Alphaproteobacteria bacterium]